MDFFTIIASWNYRPHYDDSRSFQEALILSVNGGLILDPKFFAQAFIHFCLF
jgi:hypothetical protein